MERRSLLSTVLQVNLNVLKVRGEGVGGGGRAAGWPVVAERLIPYKLSE